MPEPAPVHHLPPTEQRMLRQVGEREARVERGRKNKQAIWRSIAVLGTVGWSVTIPTFLGVGIGAWLDRIAPQRFSWTLTFLMLGLAIGCLNAWLQIKKEQR